MLPPLIVPPTPHFVFRYVASTARSFPSGWRPPTTVVTFPLARLSNRSRAVCDSGGRRTGSTAGGGQVHPDSSSPHRSQVGGRSQGVPAKRRPNPFPPCNSDPAAFCGNHPPKASQADL